MSPRPPSTHERNGILKWLTLAVVTAGLLYFAASSAATPMPRHWHAPRWWLREAVCVHGREGAWDSNTGNGYFGGMQFLLSTWRRVGGPSYPHLVSPREQLYRAWLVWRQDGGSWREWGTAGACGLR